MELHEIENWALRIVERVQAKQPVEDSLVELKSSWISPEKAARRIAGHANSARGSNILWVIGVDEDQGVVGVESNELSNWFNSIQSQFDGTVPPIQSVNIKLEKKTIVAILFETIGAPYVIKNPSFGKEKGNVVQFEVPWREGTSIRSASRNELLTILTPVINKPRIEILGGIFDAKIMERKNWDDSPDRFEWKLRLFLYIEPTSHERVVIPFQRCEGVFYFSNSEKKYRFRWVSLEPESVTWLKKRQSDNKIVGYKTIKHSITIENTHDELVLNGPGQCFLDAHAFSAPIKIPHPDNVFIDLLLYVSNDNMGIPLQVTLPRFDTEHSKFTYYFYWIKNPPAETDEILE